MAAGSSGRFGNGINKLTVPVNGRPLFEYALNAVPKDRLHKILVVTQPGVTEQLADSLGFSCIHNNRPEDGISRTIRLGTKALSGECSAILYMVSDQPLLSRKSVAGLIDLYLEHPDRIVSASSAGKRGNPCIFPERFFPALMSLTGDTGGSAVIRDHPEDLLLFDIPEEELLDTDTPEALDRIRASLLP